LRILYLNFSHVTTWLNLTLNKGIGLASLSKIRILTKSKGISMPHPLSRAIVNHRNPSLTPLAKSVLLTLSIHVTLKNPQASRSLKTLSEETGWSRKSIQDALKLLLKLNYLRILPNKIRHCYHPNLYEINISRVLTLKHVDKSVDNMWITC
jgi:hypothetical protein